MVVFVDQQEVMSYFPDKTERKIALSEGAHILQLKCNGIRSRPFVVTMNALSDKRLDVAMLPRSKWDRWHLWLSLPLWILLLLTDNWWWLLLEAAALLAFYVWVIRRRQNQIQIKKTPL